MKSRLLPLALIGSIAVTGCQSGFKLSPIGPDSPELTDTNVIGDTLSKWSPFVGLHADATAFEAYRDSLNLMIRAGQLRGVRVEIDRGGEALNNRVIRMVGSLGVEILGLVNNFYLTDPNVEQRIDEIFNAYPEIRYFQIGNEITTIDPGPHMTVEEYIAIFNRIYQHISVRYPKRILVTYALLGSGIGGPTELQKMVNLGLANTDPSKVVIAINCYNANDINGEYLGLLNGPLRGYRKWVTETGVNNQDQQISFVREHYPKLRNYLGAEAIFYYIHWGGDGIDKNFSLIGDVRNFPNYSKSPLFKVLTGDK